MFIIMVNVKGSTCNSELQVFRPQDSVQCLPCSLQIKPMSSQAIASWILSSLFGLGQVSPILSQL